MGPTTTTSLSSNFPENKALGGVPEGLKTTQPISKPQAEGVDQETTTISQTAQEEQEVMKEAILTL